MAEMTPSPYDVSIGILSQLILYLKHRGIEERPILSACGVDPALTEDPEARIDFAQYVQVEEAAAEAAGDPLFGLHMGEFIEPGHYSIIGYLMMNSRTLGEAMAEAEKYYRILGTAVKTRIRPGLGTVKVIYTLPGNAPALSHHCYDSMLASVVTLARKLTRKPLRPQQVELSRRPPPDPQEYHRVFNCPVRFDRPNNSLTLDLRLGKTPIVHPNPQLHSYFEPYAAQYLRRIEGRAETVRTAAETIHRLMGKERITAKRIASEMAMSVRTLQARLHEEGTQFQDLLQSIRKDLAKNHLQQGYRVEEIAYLLGYADAAAFSKAFKRWTGSNPRDYRQQASPGNPSQ